MAGKSWNPPGWEPKVRERVMVHELECGCPGWAYPGFVMRLAADDPQSLYTVWFDRPSKIGGDEHLTDIVGAPLGSLEPLM